MDNFVNATSVSAGPLNSEPLNPLNSDVCFTHPEQMKVAFPVLLDGDLVMSSEHLGVSYLTSILRRLDIEVKIFEVTNDSESIGEIKEYNPHLIALSLTMVTVGHATNFGFALKEALPNASFLAGGPLATFLGSKLLANPNWRFLDALVRGEGDVPIVRYVEQFWTSKDYSKVPGLSYRGEIAGCIENPIGAPIPDLDMLPVPSRDQFELHSGRLPYLRLATTRGCTSKCTFCNAPHAGNKISPGKLWRGREPKLIVDEIEDLYHRYNFNTFDFVDSTFEDPGGAAFAKQRIADIAQDILKRGLKIYYNCCMQAMNWSDKDKNLIDLLYRSGLEKVLIGIESGSQQGLKLWKKKSTVEDNKRAISLLRDFGIYVSFGFIAYHPWSTFQEIRENNSFLKEYMGHNLRRFTVRLELYPGAEALGQLRNEGLLHDDFDTTLNPLSYDFKDPRIEKLSNTIALLYGDNYAADFVIEKEPSVFEFETYDIVLHTFMSRLKRICLNDEVALKILANGHKKAEALRLDMCEFNYNLISKITDMAEKDELVDQLVIDMRDDVEKFYVQKLRQFREIQLSISLKLHRVGVPVSSIKFEK